MQKTHQIIAGVLAVLTLLSQGSVALPAGIPPEWGTWFVSWDVFFLKCYAVAAPFMLAGGDNQVGFFTSTPVATAIKEAPKAMFLAALILATGFLVCMPAHAEALRHHHRHRLAAAALPPRMGAMVALAAPAKAPVVTCTDLFNLMPVGCSPPAGQAKGFLNPIVQQVVDFLTADAPVAAAMATKYPNLQDPNGAACWTKAATLGDLIKDHPLLLSGHPIADYEAARLFNIGLNQMCVNSACTQVFTDGGNLVSKIAIGLPVPNFSQACNLIPTIPVPPAIVAVDSSLIIGLPASSTPLKSP